MQKKHPLLKNRALMGFVMGLAITLFLSLLLSAGIFKGLQLRFADTLYTRDEPSEEIVIIAIDEKSTRTVEGGLGPFSKWTRENYTRLLSVLKDEAPKVIGFDLLFDAPTDHITYAKILEFQRSLEDDLTNLEKFKKYKEFIEKHSDPMRSETDDEFASKLGEFDNVVLIFEGSEGAELYPLRKFSQYTALGDSRAELDEDGVARRTILDPYDDFASAIAKIHLGDEDLNLPLDEDGRMIINYFGDPYSHKMISFLDVIRGNFEEDFFKDKVVLVGLTTFREIDDAHITPKSNQVPMPGVEIWANAIQTILDGKFLVNQSLPGQILTIFVISAALAIILSFSGITVSIIVTLAAILLYLGAAHFFYYRGIILNMVYPFLAIVLAYLAAWVYRYFIADREKNEIKSAFSHYVSDDLVKEIAKNPEMVKLGGEKLPVTVFFSDIRGSTTLSEQTEITAWVEQINEYFTAMEKILKGNGGTLDKYEGDAIMAFWNAPLRQKDHVVRAFTTALQMKEELKRLNEKWKSEGRPELEIRIGIYSGEALVGNFGSEDRFDYTVMGDTANTASRLESWANKTYGTSIAVAGFENYTDPAELAKFNLREIDTTLLPGKKEPVKIFELVGTANSYTASAD